MPNDIISANTERLNQWFDERFAIRMEGWRKNQRPMLALLVSRGTLDGAYPPFIIATTA